MRRFVALAALSAVVSLSLTAIAFALTRSIGCRTAEAAPTEITEVFG